MLWGSAGNCLTVPLSDCPTAWRAWRVWCFVVSRFCVLRFVFCVLPWARKQPTSLHVPSGWFGSHATRRCLASNKATRNDTAACDKTRAPVLIDGDVQRF